MSCRWRYAQCLLVLCVTQTSYKQSLRLSRLYISWNSGVWLNFKLNNTDNTYKYIDIFKCLGLLNICLNKTWETSGKWKWVRWGDELQLVVTAHLPTAFGRSEESQDPVDQVRVCPFLLQVQYATDNFQFGVGEVWTPASKKEMWEGHHLLALLLTNSNK